LKKYIHAITGLVYGSSQLHECIGHGV